MDTTFNFRIDKLDALTCPKGRRHHRAMDSKVQGLGIRVRPSGAKTFVFYRRLPDNNESARKIIEFTIGKYGDVSIEQARLKATELNHLIGRGKDPSLAEPAPPTYGEIFKRYIDEYASLHTVTWKEIEKNHTRHFTQFDKRPISKITREQVQSWVNSLAKTSGKYSANRNYTTLRAVFSWAIGQGIYNGESPCIGISTFKPQARERFLQPGDEFKRFANALNAEPYPLISDFFWMCLFTGARVSNVMAMRWDEVNFDLQQWRIPRTKSGDSQTIPLTLNALEILRTRKDADDFHPVWVFPSDRKGWKTGDKGHIISPRKAFQRIVERAKIEDLRIHDLRRTAGSYMAIQNVSPTIIGKALGHRSMQSTAIYARLTQDPVRQALENAQAALADPKKLIQKAQVKKLKSKAK